MEILFEYRGSRRQLTASSGENLIECITTELHRIGRARAQVYTANVDLNTVDRDREIYLLQKWSPQWECYLDVNQASDISDGDRLAVVIKPKPPSKFLLLCCCCSGVQDQPQIQGVPRNKKNAVRKNEEIQALDYVFSVESGRQSQISELEQTQSPVPSEARETDLNEGEQYVRAESGRASWKLVPAKSSDDLAEEVESQQPPNDSVQSNESDSESNLALSLPPQIDTEPAVEMSELDVAEERGEVMTEEATAENIQVEDIKEPDLTENKLTEEISTELAKPTEDNCSADGENLNDEDKGNLDNANGQVEPVSDVVEKDTSVVPDEITEINNGGEIARGELKEDTEQKSLNDNKNKSSDEAQATVETSNTN